jgi:WD40 repeat protein
MEDWKTLKTWKGHHSRSKKIYRLLIFLAISDLAWSPDNLHFASCSTDSTISIWHVNEHCKFSNFMIFFQSLCERLNVRQMGSHLTHSVSFWRHSQVKIKSLQFGAFKITAI